MNPAEVVGATAKALIDEARRLGLTWQLMPGTVDADGNVVLDGGDLTSVPAVFLQGPMIPGQRVMCLLLPSEGSIYVIGSLGNLPTPGSLVARIRQTASQTFATAVAEFIDFDTVDYDPWAGFDPATPDRYTFPFPGIFQINGRIVWETNATSRRAVFINVNGTTSGTGSRGGSSVQAAAAGGTQVNGVGTYPAGAEEYVGLRGIQNSGGNLDTSTSDGGSCLEVVYLGQSYA